MNVLWYDSIDSTNTEALRRLGEFALPVVLAAREQTAGRGQRGNTWFSAPGQNLTFSIVLPFSSWHPFPAADAPWLNYLAAFSVATYLREAGLSCLIKWPNDIYAQRRKICGMLVENSFAGASLAASVIGIGINVNQREFPQLANATSLSLLTGKSYEVEACLAAFLAVFERELARLWEPSSRAALFADYGQLLFQRGVEAAYRDLLSGREFRGVIQGVSQDGRLRVMEGDAERYYRFKEISYIL